MAVFPLFVELKGKKCVVVGAGNVAQRKIETLIKFDAEIIIVSPQVNERIEELQQQNKVVVMKKSYSADDLEGAFLAVGATSDRKVNEIIYNDAVKNNIFVNIVDSPEKCTFIFPSVVKRDELVIGISTSGGYPALSKKVRQGIEELIPESYGRTLQVLKACRKRADMEISGAEKKKEILKRLMDELLFCEDDINEELLKAKVDAIFKDS